ncbi:MAG: GspH/FimT family pseudopilin [Burkholderiaceae bacterium]
MQTQRNSGIGTGTSRKQRGVTLIETCVVAVITAITASTAIPGMQDLLETRRVDGVATLLATDIQWVRSEAVARNQPVRLTLHSGAGNTCYVVHTGPADACTCDGSGPAQCTGESAREIRTVVLPGSGKVSVEGNVESILFDPVHGTSTPAGTLRVTGAKGRAVHHVVNVMGRVRSCSPLRTMSAYRAC